MEFTELADYALPAGSLTEWIPTTGDDLTCWTVDDRPLTYEHEQHVRGSGDCSGKDWLGAVFEIHHAYDAGAVQRTLVAWMRRHEAFRTTVSSGSDQHGNPYLLRRTNSGERLDVRAHEVGPLRTGTRVHQHLIELFDSTISPVRWPHCLAATITGGDNGPDEGRFLLIFGADHSVMDAYSMLLGINEIQKLYAAELYGGDPALSQIGSHVDFSTSDRVIGGRLTSDDNVVTSWHRFLDSAGGRFPPFCLPVAPISATFDPDSLQNGSSSWLLSTADADAINAHCKTLGSNLQSAVIAALALASRTLAGEDTFRCVMPMHTRHESQYAESVGWYVGIIPVEVDIAGLHTFAACVAAADSAVTATRNFSRFPFPRIAELLGHESTPRFVVSYLDVRFVPGAADWERWNARTLRSAAHSDDEVYLWIARTPVGMTVSARFPGNTMATTNVHRFINTLGDILTGVAQNIAGVPTDRADTYRTGCPLSSFATVGTRDTFPA